MVKLFVTTARLAQGQTSVVTVKIGAHKVQIRPTGEKFALPVKIQVVVKI